MIKVLHVLTDTNIGGAGTYVANFVNNCNKQNVLPTVLLPKGSAAIRLIHDCEIIEADIAPDKSFDFKSIGVIRKYIKAGKYDLVHAHGSASARVAAKGICKTVFTKHTLSESGSGLSGLAGRIIYRLIGGSAIAVSNSAKENLIKLGFNKKKIYTVYNGATDMHVTDENTKAECKKSFGIDSTKFVVGSMARFSPEKDYETFIRAAKYVCDKSDKFAFLLCGVGDTLNSMKSLAKDLGIYSKCVFAGIVYDSSCAYHAMDLFCMTSVYESFGMALTEAWSAGLPAIVTDALGTKEITDPEVTALVCKRKDATGIAEAMLRIYDDKQLANKLSQNGLNMYHTKYSALIFTRNLEDTYIRICNNK